MSGRSEHLTDHHLHLAAHGELANLAGRVELDVVGGGDDDDLAGRWNRVSAPVGERPREGDGHVVGDAKVRTALCHLSDLHVLAEVGKRRPLPRNLSPKASESERTLAEFSTEAGRNERLCRCAVIACHRTREGVVRFLIGRHR